jgi:hypothetical protein
VHRARAAYQYGTMLIHRDASPNPSASIPVLQDLMNDDPTPILGLVSAICTAVDLAPAPIIAPTPVLAPAPAPDVAADVAPATATAAGVTIAAAASNALSEYKENEQEMLMLDDELLIFDNIDEEMSDDEFEMQDWV